MVYAGEGYMAKLEACGRLAELAGSSAEATIVSIKQSWEHGRELSSQKSWQRSSQPSSSLSYNIVSPRWADDSPSFGAW